MNLRMDRQKRNGFGGQARMRGAAPLILVLVLVAVAVVGVVVWNLRSKGGVTVPSLTQPAGVTLALTSPTDGELAVDGEILVKGKTLPGATVTIFTEEDEAIVTADS